MRRLKPSCGACKFLRRKCVYGCVFSPFFSNHQGQSQFAAVHKIFGANNVSKLLGDLHVHNRYEGAATLYIEALARIQNPLHGCVGRLYALQHQVAQLQEKIRFLEDKLAKDTASNAVQCKNSLDMTNIDPEFQFLFTPDGLRIQNHYNEQAPDPSNAMDCDQL